MKNTGDIKILVLLLKDKIKFVLSSFWGTKMIFIYITLAADFLNVCFYDLLFETDCSGTAVVEKNVLLLSILFS
jgi:hypothetical protein